MKKVFICVLFLVSSLKAQEIATLTTPATQPSITQYQVTLIGINRLNWQISLNFTPNTGPSISCTYGSGPVPVAAPSGNVGITCSNGYTNASAPSGFATVQAMIVALNKANMTTISLEKRIYNQVIADGVFAASVTGTPQ